MGKEKTAKGYTFTAWGHPNIRATHPTTFMFTKDPDCTAQGDCIVGVSADFDPVALSEYLAGTGRVKIVISVPKERTAEVLALANKGFDDTKEIVVRTSPHQSQRTAAIRADKSARDLDRELVRLLKKAGTPISITLSKN